MQGVGLLAWRGAVESDGDYADEVAYGDRTAWAAGLHTAAHFTAPHMTSTSSDPWRGFLAIRQRVSPNVLSVLRQFG